MTPEWVAGNSISLMENGDEFFPSIVSAIGSARYEVLLETFILCDDPDGRKIQQALIDAAHRGVWVSVVVDGYGSFYLPKAFIKAMTAAGIHFYFHDPAPKWFYVRANVFRRMHRKLVVVDGSRAFIGGINLAHNHSSAYGLNFKQDYAAELRGPVVERIQRFVRGAMQAYAREQVNFVTIPCEQERGEVLGGAKVLFLTRDNEQCRTEIETQYLDMVRSARRSIKIANPYFFPGYRLLKGLRDAARSGVKVSLLIQGKPGSPLAKRGARILYDFLVESEIDVFEYWERQFHGKIATFDDEWTTIGSSNLDPLSLCLNMEANVFVQDRDFNAAVQEKINTLIEHSEVRAINRSWFGRRTLIKWFGSILIYHFLRHFPGLSGWLPPLEWRRRAKLESTRSPRNDSDDGV